MSEGPLYWSLKNSTDLRACDECGAIVHVSLVLKHTEFHLKIERQIANLYRLENNSRDVLRILTND